MALRAFIAGCAGPRLSARERAFFQAARPCGLILFKRNCASPDQIRRLIGEVREAVASDRFLVLVDQEGGRVQRLGPPHWRAYPPARAFGSLYAAAPARALQAARTAAHLMALDLSALGITVDCAPVLDVPAAGAHEVIGDRAYGGDADTVSALARAVANGLLDGGVLPVIKHMPGHGRAGVDSHVALPVVDAALRELEEVDFRPFAALRDLPLAMTAHILIPVIDAERPVSVSPAIMRQVIRGAIGYDGLVMSDDVSMGALAGTVAERAAAVIAAGVDVVLHCNGDLTQMEAIAGAVPQLQTRSQERFDAALAWLRPPAPLDRAKAEALLAELLASA